MEEHDKCPALLDVIAYFISINKSIDPVWWACRWSDMKVYSEHINPNQKPKGCMYRAQDEKYPFNVWEFIKKANKEEFINNGIAQVKQSLVNGYKYKIGRDYVRTPISRNK